MNELNSRQLTDLLIACAEHKCDTCPISSKGRSCVDELLIMAAECINKLNATQAEKEEMKT